GALADPTRPPSFGPPAASAPARATPNPAPVPQWPSLQSIRLSASARSSALLDGRLVQVGEEVGGVTLVSVDAQGVRLRRAGTERRLSLMPEVTKTAAAAASPVFPTALAATSKGIR
ncbi:MAG: hypothetical protein ABIV63_05310, partial [Caldimonas sp.]